MHLLMIGLGGFCGALCRHATAQLMLAWRGPDYPYGTLTANLVGCFLIGLLVARFDGQGLDSDHLARFFFLTGFLGSLTTYSTFSLETIKMLKTGSYLAALTHVGVHLLVGLSAVLAGLKLGEG